MCAETPLSDEALARQSRAGSLSAFSELARRYDGRIFAYLVQRAARREDAKDLTQLTFVQAWRKLGQYDPRRPFAAWLFAIARRQAIDWHRRQHPTERLAEDLAHPQTPASNCQSAEGAGTLWRAVHDLVSEKEFSALWLMYREELSVKEIAQAMGQTVVAVKVNLFRARRKLAMQLPPEFCPGMTNSKSTLDNPGARSPKFSEAMS